MTHRIWLIAFALLAPVVISAQGRGAPAGPPRSGKAAAPVDLTGYWVSQIVDEWRFRVDPQKGDIPYIPINAAARRIAMAWDPAKDISEGNQCRAYGAVGLMQQPGRLHITWQDDNTLKVEADAGTQTRIWHFGAGAAPTGDATWQGYSVASWEVPGVGRGRGSIPLPARNGTLKVVTTNMRPGYLRKNGVPYSDKATLTEYLNVLDGAQGDLYIIDTAELDDSAYLTQPFVRSYQFKKQSDAAGWDPTPCYAK